MFCVTFCLWTFTVILTSRSYKFSMFYLIICICSDCYSLPIYSSRYFISLFSNMRYFQMPQCFMSSTGFLSLIYQKQLLHVRFLMRTLPFAWISSISPTKYLFFFFLEHFLLLFQSEFYAVPRHLLYNSLYHFHGLVICFPGS